MARTKRPPLVHIPFVPRPAVTGIAKPHQHSTTTHTENTQLSREAPSKNIDISSEIKSTSSTSIEKETPAPVGVTECPHCNVDFRDMAVADVRNHVESCSRPTTASSDGDTSELSDPPESLKESADQLGGNEDQESDLEALSDLEILDGLDDGFEDVDLIDLPGPYDDDEDNEGTPSLNEESTSDVKFPKLKDSGEILASLDDIENLPDRELYRRAANVAMILDTYQKEWMALEKATAKATAGDGVPVIRNPRAIRGKIGYQDRLEADVYGYVHNPHPNFLGKQNPVEQRQGSAGDGELRSRLRKQTKKAVEADNESDQNTGEAGRPVRNRNTPSRFDSQSREQTPSNTKKPRGRGKGGRLGELRAEVSSRPPGYHQNLLANWKPGEYAEADLFGSEKALASTEADEDSGASSRPTTSSSTQSRSAPGNGLQAGSSTSGRKRRATSTIDGNSTKKTKKARITKSGAPNSGANTNTSDGASKARARNMVEVAPGVFKSTQSVMMSNRWAAYRADPSGPRIGRIRKSQSEKGTGSDANSSRKHSLDEPNDQGDTGPPGKKRKISKEEPAEEDIGAERSERGSQAPAKGKRGGRREGSGRKPAKASYKAKRQPRAGTASRDGEHEAENSPSVEDENDRAVQTPAPVENEERIEPSSSSTRASTRARKPSIAKQEADDGKSSSAYSQPTKKAKGQWGGKREKGKRNDGTPIVKSKQSAKSRGFPHLDEGMVADTDRTEDENGNFHEEEEDDEEEDDEEEEEEDDGEDDDEDDDEEQTSGPQKKHSKHSKGAKANQSPVDDYPDLPVYDKNNLSAEYKALPKNLKMKAVSRARWANGGMGHMFGQKGPNKTTKQKAVNQTASNTGSVNSARTSVSATNSAPPSSRRRAHRNMGIDGIDEYDMETTINPPNLKRKISEYEEFQALASPTFNQAGAGTRRRRPAALRASISFIEPNTSSDFEDEEDAGNTDDNNNVYEKKSMDKKEKVKNGSSRKGIGGRPPRMMNPIQTDIANERAGVMRSSGGGGSGSGSGGGTALTAYEEFQALSAPGTPMVLGKRNRKSGIKGTGNLDDDEYEGGDDDFRD